MATMSARGVITSSTRSSWNSRAWLTSSPVSGVSWASACCSPSPLCLRKRVLRIAMTPRPLVRGSLLLEGSSVMVPSVRLVGIRNSQPGQDDAFEAFHSFGLIIAHVIVS